MGFIGFSALTWLSISAACTSTSSRTADVDVGAGGEPSGGSGGSSAFGGSGGSTAKTGPDMQGGMAGEGGDAGAGGFFGECEPKQTEECWETPDGEALPDPPEELLGNCRMGVRTCGPSGVFGACVGAVAPLEEDSCEPGADENCNGIPNEGCPCADGEMRACGTDEGNCESGTQLCVDGAWGPCEGGVGPAAQDSCEVAGDDADCDGVPNGGCPCVGAATEECGECGERVCDPEARGWGPCEPKNVTEACWESSDGMPFSDSVPETLLGNCQLGVRACEEGGNFGACMGAVGPAKSDSCLVPGDDATCNGVPNEGCPCTGNETRTCGTDVGACEKGTQRCISGTWGPCEDEIAPAAQDRCDVAGDDSNCNGIPNEGCPCVGNQTEACNDCGSRTCNPAQRAWGPCTAPQNPAATRCAPSGNAVQTCDSNGRWTSSTCTTSDSHCTSTCEVSGGKAQCRVRAADKDGDGHGDALCSAAPGDDCNDASAAAYPGATEKCDGIDNDCDGAVDLRDGLVLSGSTKTVGGVDALDLAWNPVNSHFGWVGTSNTSPRGIVFGTLSTSGTVGSTNLIATPGGDSTASQQNSRIAYSPSFNGGSFGVFYTDHSKAGVIPRWVNVTKAGDPGTQYDLPAPLASSWGAASGDIATRSDGDFVVAYGDYNGEKLYFARIENGKGLADEKSVNEGALSPRIATSGQTHGIVYTIGTAVRWVRVNNSLTLQTSQAVGSPGRGPDIAGVPSGYAIAWRTATGVAFRVYSTTGAAVCGPTNVVYGDTALNDDEAVAVENTAYGVVVLATDSNKTARIFRFDPSTCALIDWADVQTNSSLAILRPAMAVGGGKLAISWVGGTMVNVRVLNEALCQ